MFDTTIRSHAEAETASLVADVAALTGVAWSGRSENMFAARKVLAAGRLWESWIERDVRLGSGAIVDCGNGAIAELSVRLGCSKTVAESHASLGMDLRLRLPETRTLFEAGFLDLARVRVIARETTGLSPETVAAIEPEIVSAAEQLTPGPLAAEIGRLVAERSPAEAAQHRADAVEYGRRIVKRSRGNLSTIEVSVSPEEGEAFMQLVAEFAATVCPHDKRGKQCRLVDPLMGLVHGEPYLECTCGRDDCAAAGRAGLPSRRAPLTQITMDVATLLGLLSKPAYLHGHGLLDPELARQLAADGTWQAMLTEVLDLAEQLGLVVDDEARAADAVENDQFRDTETARAERSTEPQAPNEPPAQPPSVTSPLPPRFCLRSYLARGARRSAGYVPEFGSLPGLGSPPSTTTRPNPAAPIDETPTTAPTPTPTPTGTGTGTSTVQLRPASAGTVAKAILAAIEADPTLALGAHPDGHGGLAAPPDGALTYRPDAATAALVRARDQHCRFPGCTRPAAQCQLDHIVEYRSHEPLSGGWTIVTNLECLCQFHHQLKTLGFWDVTALAGHALLWTSSTGATAVTLPAGAHHGNHTLATPAPVVTGRRGSPPTTRQRAPAHPDPPPF
ncbi:DUF222 domain-containing protein [Rhodococcus spelaei]|uniref:DUF222 domain-containing protein n=1 Tax=Rhodococcus spelaei TaxID=2546320 RepID=A0A541BMU5_9NOCA|nr:HNH endonuclease signature motif containing protein [Rhodococcus spelaei]TQF73630.1 DUF222 domain-containing protein [Rhodococcus spelaei]